MTDLLPSNATQLERNLAASLPLDRLPVALRSLWNPQTCPPDQLPWLAWAWSVDDWDSGWTTEQKREAIASAVYIHRHKGTRAAVLRAVTNISPGAQLHEWFNHDGAPYSFRLTLRQGFATQNEYQRFQSLVGNAKNVRSLLERISRHVQLAQPLYLGGFTQSSSTQRIELAAEPPATSPQSLAVATVHQHAQHITLHHHIGNRHPARAAVHATLLQTARITTIEAHHG